MNTYPFRAAMLKKMAVAKGELSNKLLYGGGILMLCGIVINLLPFKTANSIWLWICVAGLVVMCMREILIVSGKLKINYDWTKESVIKQAKIWHIADVEKFVKMIDTLKSKYNLSDDEIDNLFMEDVKEKNKIEANKYILENNDVFL